MNKIDLGAKAATVLAAIAVPVAIYMTFIYAPVEAVMGWPQKIFYFHVPIAVLTYLGFMVTFAGSIGYLWKNDMKWDRYAVVGAEVGVLFASLMLITGMLWGRPIWGAYWTWDPRLTTSLVLWLIFVGYLLLRSQVGEPTMRAKYAAVVGIVGYADVPLVHYSVQLWSRGIHPPKPELHPDMATALKVSFVAITLVFVALFLTRLRYEILRDRVDRIKAGSR
jgi:heme exporter protein C